VIAAQAESAERLAGMLNTGGMLLHPVQGRWSTHLDAHPEQIVSSPHVVGIARDDGKRPGSWVDLLFNRDAPRLGFTRAQQRLLLAAAESGTDEDLADALGITLSAVKKTWRQIYDRVADSLPELTERSAKSGDDGRRGKGKKWQILYYVREHPEELRPVARSLVKLNRPDITVRAIGSKKLYR
jgi:DNA-binding CsgD family transcriptional regulator